MNEERSRLLRGAKRRANPCPCESHNPHRSAAWDPRVVVKYSTHAYIVSGPDIIAAASSSQGGHRLTSRNHATRRRAYLPASRIFFFFLPLWKICLHFVVQPFPRHPSLLQIEFSRHNFQVAVKRDCGIASCWQVICQGPRESHAHCTLLCNTMQVCARLCDVIASVRERVDRKSETWRPIDVSGWL